MSHRFATEYIVGACQTHPLVLSVHARGGLWERRGHPRVIATPGAVLPVRVRPLIGLAPPPILILMLLATIPRSGPMAERQSVDCARRRGRGRDDPPPRLVPRRPINVSKGAASSLPRMSPAGGMGPPEFPGGGDHCFASNGTTPAPVVGPPCGGPPAPMAFRQVRVFETCCACGCAARFRGTERSSGVDRKTVRRYIETAVMLGVVRDGGEGTLTDVFVGQVVVTVRPQGRDGHGSSRPARSARAVAQGAEPHGGQGGRVP